MARLKADENLKDPATGKPLPQGVLYRGPKQYRARKLVHGHRVTRTFENARLARAWLEEASVKIREGRAVDDRALDGMVLRALIERYRDDCMAHRERDRQGDKFAPATVVKRLNLLASIFQHAMSEWDVPLTQNPASGRLVKRPAGADRKRNRRLEESATVNEGPDGPLSEYDRLLAVVTSESHPDDVWFVRWAIEQATRRGEAAMLRWRDVDFDRKTISVARPKNDKHREELGPEIRPLMPGTLALLKNKCSAMTEQPDPDAPIFDIGGEDAFSVRYGRAVRKAGLTNLTFHDLRHEATSRLARLFPNPMDLCRVTGHRDLKSLDRYYQPIMTQLANDAAERARLLGIIYGDADE
ncbi:site-specific integrase [Acidomonas methanolica]|uniref:Phage DNA recombinase n=1 Tax=Acidomonas methanolica NBRC 104435 TaxID=1231351 RepID=A0A023D9A8_ACIMT|nr:site-specific integrase [Acidomonas methanolica]MBU2655812.1 site-specific integrase [Acidomonas methanolica]TCS19030.1 integrase [Acidomonas methanolica]GAJ30742.1 phage DNA recombinase [Acidomonas methanolica NBRC 104435]GBQ48284.1 phage DNA recombinase [Acidomonas methanolica]GEL00750.1 hypothetical protein AME01nite_32480 [Acidomonas methanolica NBRC 104435]